MITGPGTVSNRGAECSTGHSCIAEARTVETTTEGEATTLFRKHGDTGRIERLEDRHHSIFGTVERVVASLEPPVKLVAAALPG